MFCTSCGQRIESGARFCGSCGAPARPSVATVNEADPADGETIAPAPAARPVSSVSSPKTPRSHPSGSLASSDPIGGGRFVPGQILAERYRIVALAGRGGMGEVYRAEDLTLSQVVAIKFLPADLTRDGSALARFHSEVRVARQIAHPNVCRVFDIGDTDGIPFLTMEYVDGEDLSSSLRRFGKLSPDKAVEITRQICAGLAAAHDRGVVHRDLKPANIMLDGHGKVRITDFGLAGLAATLKGAEVRAGTPAYMAPEQLAGREVTAKSDLYSVGLILYEVLTGKRAFEAPTLGELMKLREDQAITRPSTLVRDLDPLVERVILRCLDNDPARRPESAFELAAALPGGDPLAAALAAGETPSPEMVAAAGAREGIKPWIGLTLAATVLIGLIAQMFVADRYAVQNLTPLDKSPEVLLARCQEIIEQLGIRDLRGDSAYGFSADLAYLGYIEARDKSESRWRRLSSDRPATLLFWYRQSPRELASTNFFSSGRLGPSDPPSDVTGMIGIEVDTAGRLVRFERVPPEHNLARGPSPAPDWSALFAATGLNPAAFTVAEPEWTPLLYADSRAAWTRQLTEPVNVTERVEAAAYRGQPVFFRVLYPWNKPVRDQGFQPSRRQKFASSVVILLFATVLVGGIVVVRRNKRLARGDETGSVRLGSFLFLVFLGMWALRAHHFGSAGEVGIVLTALAGGFLISSLARLLYFALEPFVRRRDPHTLIGWARLIGGKIRDPLVGRDVLIGTAFGVLLALFESSDNYLLPLFGKLPPRPGAPAMESLVGVRLALGAVLAYTWIWVLASLGVFFLLFLLRILVRKDWISALVIIFLGAMINTGGEYFWATFLAAAVIWLSMYLVLRRFGLLALVVGMVVQNTILSFPLTSHLGRWYAAGALLGVALIAVLALFALVNALAGQAWLTAKVFDD